MAKIFEIIQGIFSILCILVTLGLVAWCFYEYQLDLDLSLVTLKEFGEDENMIMPDVSLCFMNPFLMDTFDNESIFDNGNNGMSPGAREYKKFLIGFGEPIGKTWDEKMLDIDFETVTKKLDDYLESYLVTWRNGSVHVYENTSSLPAFIKKPYPLFFGPFKWFILKCYGINIPMDAERFGFRMKRDIFPGGIRPVSGGLTVSFNYPNQFFKSFDNIKREWPIHNQSQNQSLDMQLRMNTFEVTLQRNSRRKPCDENWKGYDFKVARKHLEKVGCRPVYDIWNSSYPICNSFEKMKMASKYLSFNRPKIMEPCQSADKIVFQHMDKYTPHPPNHHLWVTVDIAMSRIKVIEQKRAVTFTDLVGSTGGYIGLLLGTYYISIHKLYTLYMNYYIEIICLYFRTCQWKKFLISGYAIIQLPGSLRACCVAIRKYLSDKEGNKRNYSNRI